MSLELHEITRALDLSGKKHGFKLISLQNASAGTGRETANRDFFDFLFQGRRAPCQDHHVRWVPKAKRIEKSEADVVYNTMITDADVLWAFLKLKSNGPVAA